MLRPVRLPVLGTVHVEKPTFWREANAVYSLLGWLLTSLAILTYSGMFKRSNAD